MSALSRVSRTSARSAGDAPQPPQPAREIELCAIDGAVAWVGFAVPAVECRPSSAAIGCSPTSSTATLREVLDERVDEIGNRVALRHDVRRDVELLRGLRGDRADRGDDRRPQQIGRLLRAKHLDEVADRRRARERHGVDLTVEQHADRCPAPPSRSPARGIVR